MVTREGDLVMIFYKNYLEKARKLNISSDFLSRLYTLSNKEGLDLIKSSNNEREVYINVQGALYNSHHPHFFDFSYLLGLEFGVFNVYRFEPLSLDIKRKFSSMSYMKTLNRENTYYLFQNHMQAMATYLSEKYLYPTTIIYKTMEEMFYVNERNPYFSDDIAIDIGKMVTSYYLYINDKEKNNSLGKKELDLFFQSGEALLYFEAENHITNFKKKS